MSWLIDTLVTTGALIALVLLLRRPVARHFGAGAAYGLWLLPVLRLLIPPIVLPAPPAQVAQVELVLPISAATGTQTVAPVAAAFPWHTVLSGLWLGGAALFLGWRLGGYVLMRRRVLRNSQLIERRGAVRVVESCAVPMPVAFGVIDKVIALPSGFRATYGARATELALAHELAHHAGRDLALNLAMQPLLALHWFNPLAWLGWRALRRDQETACDARVLAGRDKEERGAYAGLIATLAQGHRPGLAAPLACAVIAEKSIIHRLRSMTMNDPSPRRRLAGRMLIAAGVVALPLTATISYAAAQASAEPAPAPAPAASPEPAAKPHVEQHVVIVDRQGPAGDDSKMTTRVVTRGGKTVTFSTDKPLSDEEIDKKVDEALAAATQPPEADAGPGEQRRVIVRRIGPQGDAHAMSFDTETIEGKDCKNGEPVEVNESTDASGQKHSMRIKLCISKTVANALQSARDEIAQDNDMPADIKTKVLKQLDEDIARNNAKQG